MGNENKSIEKKPLRFYGTIFCKKSDGSKVGIDFHCSIEPDEQFGSILEVASVLLDAEMYGNSGKSGTRIHLFLE